MNKILRGTASADNCAFVLEIAGGTPIRIRDRQIKTVFFMFTSTFLGIDYEEKDIDFSNSRVINETEKSYAVKRRMFIAWIFDAKSWTEAASVCGGGGACTFITQVREESEWKDREKAFNDSIQTVRVANTVAEARQ